ncbi:heme-degrading domain-containing protein [Companilactobacillus baiquanensis]|uniref:Heme-degrading domain-containing protein n=1 Tax=Companilactobacillus baiquanensis TaxID=2486005 RepID=A0ABW1UVV7_9LACO|nr:heme-degrading domain-containing protein [Companilactobacillus baiquanensis]
MITLKDVLAQEKKTELSHFNLKDVDGLVDSLKKIGKDDFNKVCILIKINQRIVYFHAGDQTTNENNLWIKKKENVVDAFDHSSLFKKIAYQDNPESFYKESGLSPKDYAIVGGGYPIAIENTGVIGSLIVSGLTDTGDHELAYNALLDFKSSIN